MFFEYEASTIFGRAALLVPTLYGYIPTKSICILFIVLFSVSTGIHVGQAVFYRIWWLLATIVLCGALEIAGWGARLWASSSPMSAGAYEMQMICTILGPTPLLAANFIILGTIINRLGPSYSRISPKWYSVIFLTCDFISLVVQGIGGGMAAVALNNNEDPSTGGNIMLGGIVFQMFTITMYVACAAEFFIRYFHDKPLNRIHETSDDAYTHPAKGQLNMRLKIMTSALIFTTLCLWIRAVYRTIELADGWTGRIIHTQVYFNVLDGAMIVLAIYTLNFAHPGIFLRSQHTKKADPHHTKETDPYLNENDGLDSKTRAN